MAAIGDFCKVGGLLTLSEQDSDSAVDEDTLLHGEALLVVTAGDSESVALELVAEDLAVDIGAHPPVVEVTAKNEG